MSNRPYYSPTRYMLLGLALQLCLASNVDAISIPDDPRQSIVYWKPHILADTDPSVVQVNQIFNVLLRTWNNSRIAPSVHVVNSTTGPWAASLADGNILLSVDAVKTCMSFGETRATHLLAFVLAHELAHQRSDDLWHQKFFRLIGNQTALKQTQLLRGIDKQWLSDVERKEAQADHDGLVIMASVGYDPFQISNRNDFFTTWVEQIWKGSCAEISNSHPAKSACQKAETRSLRTQTQLETTATQTTLYELALQAFVAGDLLEARKLFKIYGRELPGRAVYTGIGLTYLRQAITLKHDKTYLRKTGALNFYYPMLIDTKPTASKIDNTGTNTKRGDSLQIKKLTAQIHKLAADAIHYFERASKLEPDHRQPYLLLAMAYLVDNNTFMARGILQGKYNPSFGDDAASGLLLAMTTATEGKTQAAIKEFQRLIQSSFKNDVSKSTLPPTLPSTLLQYATTYNLSQIYQKQKSTQASNKLWQTLAQQSKNNGNTILFRMALSQLNTNTTLSTQIAKHPQIFSFRPGDILNLATIKKATQHTDLARTDVWVEGEKRVLFRIPKSGARFFVNAENIILNAWQQGSASASIGRLSIGDPPERAHKVFGIPDREIFFTHGTYLAYDNFGFGLHIVNKKVVGWFLYDKS